MPWGSRACHLLPRGDRDRAVFTAKPGYAYRIETPPWPSGRHGPRGADRTTRLTNDDSAPRNLSSALTSQRHRSERGVHHRVEQRAPTAPRRYTLLVSDAAPGRLRAGRRRRRRPWCRGRPGAHLLPAGDVDRCRSWPSRWHRYACTPSVRAAVDTVLRCAGRAEAPTMTAARGRLLVRECRTTGARGRRPGDRLQRRPFTTRWPCIPCTSTTWAPPAPTPLSRTWPPRRPALGRRSGAPSSPMGILTWRSCRSRRGAATREHLWAGQHAAGDAGAAAGGRGRLPGAGRRGGYVCSGGRAGAAVHAGGVPV